MPTGLSLTGAGGAFISLQPPVNTVAPALSGTANFGNQVSTTLGTWTGAVSYAYQWETSVDTTTWLNATGDGASTSAYAVSPSSQNLFIRGKIVATNADGSTSAFTTSTGVISSEGKIDPNSSFFQGATIRVLVIQPDGKVLVGGDFLSHNGTTVNRIVRLNADGTRDTAFTTNTGTAANNPVYNFALQPDGKILVGGEFTSWNGVTGVNRIVRLNSDGTRDTAFTTNVGTAASDRVSTIAIQSDGKLVVGGIFSNWTGVTVNGIVRLNSDGTRDTAFTTSVGSAVTPGGFVNDVRIQPDGKLVVGHTSAQWSGVTVNRIVRLNSDGTRDTAFTTNTGTAANSSVTNVTLQPDGRILLGGNFTTWGGVTVGGIVRLNADGTRDTAFTTNAGTAGGSTSRTAIQTDGKILVGTGLTWNGTTVNNIVRLNADGTRDTAFTTNTGTAAGRTAWAFAIQSDGKILVGGDFLKWNNQPVDPRIVRLNSDGTRDTSLSTILQRGGADFELVCACVQPDEKMLLAGTFTIFNGVPANGFVRLNNDKTLDTAFLSNLGTGAAITTSTAIALQPDGKILVGSNFTAWNGVTVGRIVRLNADGTRDTAFTTNNGTGADNQILAIAVQPDGKILIGGTFLGWNGTTVNRIVRLNADGTRDTAFTTNTGTGGNSSIRSLVVQSDGKILVGGDFATWNGVTGVNRIVRLNADGTRETAFNTNGGTGPNSSVFTIAVQSDGKILVGGAFTTWNALNTNRIARLESNGTRDAAFTSVGGGGPSGGTLNMISLQPDGKILVGGSTFTTWSGVSANRVVRLNSDGTRDTTFITNFGLGANAGVRTIFLLPNERILIGGSFTAWNTTDASNLINVFSTTTQAGTPRNTVVPTITGPAPIFSFDTLTASTGTWSFSPTSYSYQWERSLDGITWLNISGATNATYSTVSTDVKHFLRVRVTASNGYGAGISAASSWTSRVL